MGIRVNKVLGWGLLNIGVDDRYRVTDPRLNPDGLLLNNDRSGQWTTTGLREWAEANNRSPRFGLPRRWDQSGDTELVHCFIMDVEYGLDVLVIRPLSEPKWHRYDDSIDWIEETYVKEPSDRNGDPWFKLLRDNPWPYSGRWVNGRTGERVRNWQPLRWAMNDYNDGDEEPPGVDADVRDAGFESWDDALLNLVPEVPWEVRAMCEYGQVFTDPETVNDLRPIMYCFWA